LNRAITLIEFAYFESTCHAKPHIVINIDQHGIRAGVWRNSLVFFELPCLLVELTYLSGVILNKPKLSFAINCNSPCSAIIFVGGGYSVILLLFESILAILWPVSAAYHAFPRGSVIKPYGEELLVVVGNPSMAPIVKLSLPIL
jgi:hypothetical protein